MIASTRAKFGPSLALAVAIVSCTGSQPAATPGATYVGPIGIPEFIDSMGRPLLGATEIAVDFGPVPVGSAVRRDVLIANGGGAAFTITQAPALTGSSDAFRFAPASVTVDPRTRGVILVTFAPTAAGEAEGALQLAVENGACAALTIRVRGSGAEATGPSLAVGPSRVDFGITTSGTSREQRLSLGNTGLGAEAPNGALRLATRAEDGGWHEAVPRIIGADAAAFSLEWPPEGYTAAGLEQGRTVDLSIRFSPIDLGRKSAILEILSNDASQPRLEVPLEGDALLAPPCAIDVQPRRLNFGAVGASKYLTLAFAVRNLDADPQHECIVSVLDPVSLDDSPVPFTLVNGPVSRSRIPGGEALLVPVRFQASTGGTFSSEISVIGSDSNRPETKVQLLGAGEGDCLVITPNELVFPAVGVNCNSRQRLFTMYNRCSAPLTLAAIDLLAGPTYEFAVTRKPALPLMLSCGASTDFGVTYHPTSMGRAAGLVAIYTAGSDVARYYVPVMGTGTQGGLQTDEFTQPDPPKQDILFIVDNSATMADKQASLVSNFASFIHYAAQQRVDLHIAITTTDVTSTGAAGRFLPLSGITPRVLTMAMPTLQQYFSQTVAVGTNGSETESLIRPAYLALTTPLINGNNAGFYRDDAKLAVFVVSDAADQDPLDTPESFYESFLLNLKGIKRRNDLTVSGIIPIYSQAPEGCTYDTAAAGVDARMKQLIQRTGGLMDDICNPDWAKTLEKLGTRVFGERTTFFLSNVPDMTMPDPITIAVDGQRFDQYGSKGDKRWDYNSASNAIEFDPLAVPDPSSRVSISYYVACQ